MQNTRIQVHALGALLSLLPFAIFVSAVSAARANPLPHTQDQKQYSPRGPREMADGQIKDVSCKGRAMDMVFDTSEEILRLHTDNYFEIEFSALNYTPHGKMNPCKQGKGMYARVYYYAVKGHPKEGVLSAVQFRK